MIISVTVSFFYFLFSFLVALLFIILMVLRRRRDNDGELTLARAPLLRKERPQGRYYGIPCDAEPVYAGWWTKGPQFNFPTVSAWLDKTIWSPVYVWVSTKDKKTNRRRLMVKSWAGAIIVLWQSTSFFYVVHVNIFLRNTSSFFCEFL